MSQSFTLSIRKIASLDDRSPETLVATIALDPESTVTTLRQSLCSERIMAPLDAFMLPSEPKFALAKVDEDHKSWTTVLGDSESITLLTTEKNEQDVRHRPGALRGWWNNRHNSDQETQSETRSTTADSLGGERQVTTTGILKASDLAEAIWEEIVTGQSLTHGVTLGTGRASQDPGPQRAARPLVTYQHASVTRLVSDATTKDDSVFNTERNHKYAQKGWIDGTVNITTPYATASIEAVRSEAFARDLVNKTIHVTNTHIIQRAKVQFARQRLTLSKEFQELLDSIMLLKDDDEKRTAFEHLFESYGHVFPLQVVLRGTFIQSAIGQVKDESEVEDKKHELRASLNAHIFGAGAGGGIGGGNSEEKGDSSRTLGFTSTIDVNGGDSTLILDPKAWMESVKDHNNWRVVRIEKVIPIVDLVSPEARAEIARVAPPAKCKALYGKWIDLRPQSLPDGMCKGLRRFPAPEISGDSWFWLGQPIGDHVLIVKERIPGSLCKIKSVEPIWNSKGKWPWLGMVNYLGNPFPEQSESFEALASCVYCQPRIDFKAPQPDIEVEPWSKLRAVRHELLVKGECDTDIWNDKGKHGPDQASLWSIKHDDSTVNIDSFKAFAGRDKQTTGVWRLKADEVEMVE